MQEQTVREFIEERLELDNIDRVKVIAMSKFKINSNRFAYIWRKMNLVEDFVQIVANLKSAGYSLRSFQGKETSMPELLLMSCPEMRKAYEEYGDVVCFDVTYNLLKKRYMDNKQWGVGFFCGIGHNLEIAVFAVTLICNESKDSFKRLFLNFF